MRHRSSATTQIIKTLIFQWKNLSVQPPRWSIKSIAGALFFWHLWDCARWSRLQGWTVSRFCRDDLSYAIFHCSIIHSHNTLHRSFWPHQQNPHLAPALLTVFGYPWLRPLSKFNIQHKRSSYWHSKQIHICRRSEWSLQTVINLSRRTRSGTVSHKETTLKEAVRLSLGNPAQWYGC